MSDDRSKYLPVVQNDPVNIFAALHPFATQRQDYQVLAGATIGGILTGLGRADLAGAPDNVRLFVDDALIDPKYWDQIIPQAGQTIAIRVVASGGGDGKNILRAVMMIAVTAFATYLSGPMGTWMGSELAGGFAAAAVGVAGNLAVNALIPYVPHSEMGGSQLGAAGGLSPAVTGTRNSVNLYGPIPRVFGTCLIYPLLAAEPYTENSGEDSWLRMLFMVGWGEYYLGAAKIGQTDLTTFAPDYQISAGFYDELDDIYPYDVHQDSLSIEITNASGWNEQTTPADTTEIILDMTFPDGIWKVFDSGNKRVATIVIEAEYSIADADDWTAFSGSPWSAAGNWNKRWTGSFRAAELTAAAYDVRVRRTTSDTKPGGVEAINDDCWWTAMRSIRYGLPFALDGVTLIALRIKASGVLNGVIDQFNVVATAKLPTWTGSAWSAPTATRSLAWAFAEVLRGAANNNPVADSKIDGAGLSAWDTACTAAGFNFDAVIDSKTTVFELLRKIAAAGRASLGFVDNQYTIVRDILQTTARQHFSPRNSWEFSSRKVFLDLPHGFRGRFVNAAAGYRTDEIVITDDGYYYAPDTAETTWSGSTAYSAGDMVAPTTPAGYLYQCTVAGTSGGGEPSWPTTIRATVTDGGVTWMCEAVASRFETMDYWGVTDAEHVFKLARYHIAVARLRPETYQISTDVEWVVCVRGDMVRLTHDILLVGLGQGRIKEIDGNDVTLDVSVAGIETYGAQIRKADGTMMETTLSADAPGDQTTVTLGDVGAAAVGDMIFYGETGSESIECLVSRIEPGPDMSARLTLIPAAPAVHDADTSQIPAYDPGMTVPPPINREPPTPVIESVTLAAYAIGTDITTATELRAVIDFSVATIDPQSLLPAYCQGQYRTVDDGPVYSPWLYTNDIPLDQRYFEVVVEDGRSYDFRVRAVSEFGVTSAWDDYAGYTVTYTPNVPNDIANLALVGGGSTWAGRDVALIWDQPTDLWRISKYQLNIYTTDPLTLVRVETVPVGMLTADYSYAQNYEDHSGSPTGALTFRIWALAADNTPSAAYDQLVVTHTAPAAVTSLAGQAYRGGVIFSWDANTDPAFSHFAVRLRVESDSWSQWFQQSATTYKRALTAAEVDDHGPDATIYIEVTANDVFNAATDASASNENAASLYVQPTDIDDFAVDASKLYFKIPVLEGLALTDDSPTGGDVAWNAHSLFYNGQQYSINAGNTDDYYIYWKDLAATTYSTSNTHPADNLSDWDPEEDFIIAVNDDGSAQAAWNAIANQIVGSAYIMDAAIQDLHVDNVSGDKIIANSVTAAQIEADTITAAEIAAGVITATEIAANTITAAQIAAGVITAAEIAAGAITLTGLASEVSDQLGPTHNLIKNGEFTKDAEFTETPTDWDAGTSGSPPYHLTYNPATYDPPWNANDASCFYVSCDNGAEYGWIRSADFIAVDENKDFCLSAWVYGLSGSRSLYLGLHYYDENEDLIATQYPAADDYSPPSAWTQIDGTCYASDSSETNRFSAGTKYVKIICYVQYEAVGANFISRICLNEGRRPQRGVTVIDGGSIYAESITASQINGGAFGELEITSGKIALNTSDALEIQAGGNVRLLAGGDMILTPADSGPSKIVFEDSGAGTYDLEIFRYATNDTLFMAPSVDNTCRISLGRSSHCLTYLEAFASTQIKLNCLTGSDEAILNLQGGQASLGYNDDVNGTCAILFDTNAGSLLLGNYFRPYTDSTTTLGSASVCWSNIYGDAGVTSCSDKKYKKNMMPTPLGLEFISALVPVQFEWDAAGKRPKQHAGRYHGLVASEVEQALIDSGHQADDFAGIEKTTDDEGQIWYGLKYDQLIAPLIRAVQQLSDQIQHIQKQI